MNSNLLQKFTNDIVNLYCKLKINEIENIFIKLSENQSNFIQKYYKKAQDYNYDNFNYNNYNYYNFGQWLNKNRENDKILSFLKDPNNLQYINMLNTLAIKNPKSLFEVIRLYGDNMAEVLMVLWYSFHCPKILQYYKQLFANMKKEINEKMAGSKLEDNVINNLNSDFEIILSLYNSNQKQIQKQNKQAMSKIFYFYS